MTEHDNQDFKKLLELAFKTNKADKDKTQHTEGNMEDNFKTILAELEEVFLAKNSDYGGSVDITYLMFGETAQLVRLWDKLLRATHIHISGKSEVLDEKVEDTLKDLANYTIIALAQRNTYKEGDKNATLGKAFSEFITKAKTKSKKEY